jgi:hypothetical protein
MKYEYVEKRTRKNTFFKHVNLLIDWREIEKEINKVYTCTLYEVRSKRGHSVSGRPAYSGLLLFTCTTYEVRVRCFCWAFGTI